MMLHKVKFKKRRSSRTPSTFTLSRNPHSTNNNKLHSKSTYFYRWGSRKDKLNTSLSSCFSYVIPIICILALLVGEIITINPLINNIEQVNATGNESAVRAGSAPTVSLGLEGEAVQETAATAGTVAYRSNVFKVGGTGMSKYVVTLNTPAGKTGELVGRSNPYATVGKVSANTTKENFGDNTWGYAVSTRDNYNTITDDNMTYNPVPSGMDGNSNSVNIARREEIYGAEINDSYRISFAAKLGDNIPPDHYETDVYLSVVANPFISISSVTTMQEISSHICEGSYIGQVNKLKDERDGKIYWVTKLADGNCWMTQNLAYDGGGTKQCTLDGDATCSGWPGYENKDNNPRYAVGLHIDGDHASVGNYYSWSAAVNGDTGTTEPKQGICPDNWQLPRGRNAYNKSLNGLTTAYNLGYDVASSVALRADPLYFVFGGIISYGKLGASNSYGRYWSSTPGESTNTAYNLYLDTNGMSIGYESTFYGYSVRCVSK